MVNRLAFAKRFSTLDDCPNSLIKYFVMWIGLGGHCWKAFILSFVHIDRSITKTYTLWSPNIIINVLMEKISIFTFTGKKYITRFAVDQYKKVHVIVKISIKVSTAAVLTTFCVYRQFSTGKSTMRSDILIVLNRRIIICSAYNLLFFYAPVNVYILDYFLTGHNRI